MAKLVAPQRRRTLGALPCLHDLLIALLDHIRLRNAFPFADHRQHELDRKHCICNDYRSSHETNIQTQPRQRNAGLCMLCNNGAFRRCRIRGTLRKHDWHRFENSSNNRIVPSTRRQGHQLSQLLLPDAYIRALDCIRVNHIGCICRFFFDHRGHIIAVHRHSHATRSKTNR